MKYTGILHAHSTYSYDGKLCLAELKTLLFKHGHSFCCVTEHTDELTPEQATAFVAECERLSDQAFVFVPGFEVPYKDAHVLHIGTTEFLGQFADPGMLMRWRAATPFVVLAHPVRNRFKIDETLASVIDGIEVWNQQYEGKAAPRFRSLKLFRDLWLAKENLLVTGGLDFHRKEHYGTPHVTLEVDSLTVEKVVDQLRLGFYTVEGKRVVLTAHGEFKKGGGLLTRLASAVSIFIITVGKAINKVLALFGFKLPRFIRAKI